MEKERAHAQRTSNGQKINKSRTEGGDALSGI